MIKTLTLLSLALTVVSGQDVVAGFKAEGVLDDVLIEAPPALLEVKYVEQDVKAELGNTLAVSKTGSQPEVIFAGAKRGQQYTLGRPGSLTMYTICTFYYLFSPTCSHGGP